MLETAGVKPRECILDLPHKLRCHAKGARGYFDHWAD
jgi:hypothetical protein